MSLTVATTQSVALRLYDSLGFTVFGLERGSLFVNGDYVEKNIAC